VVVLLEAVHGVDGIIRPLPQLSDYESAALSLDGFSEHASDGFVEVRVVDDDDRVLPSHLGDHVLDVLLARRGLGDLSVDPQADLAGADERDDVDARMVDESLADLRPGPGKNLEHSGESQASSRTRAR
jgi:hypothetical protein